jgi:Glycosyl transferases group 1
MAERARAFASRLAPAWSASIICRRGSRVESARRFRSVLVDQQPTVTYAMDMGVDAVTAAAWHRVSSGTRLVVDTGDAITALARSSGLRGPVGRLATAGVEETALRISDHVVVRGSHHRELLAARGVASTFVPDGVDLQRFKPVDGSALRQRLGLQDTLIVGLVGSSVWSPRLGLAYGWDLVELLALTRDLPVRGLLIGDGSGLERLAGRARELGVADRLVLAGRQPLADLPTWLAACDVCLSTQTNDTPGRVRTTGKLPLYLATGRYILASNVGEAARVLPEEMLVPYDGTIDRAYPVRLANRVRQLMAHPERLARGASGVDLARRHFDYDRLARRLDALFEGLQAGDASALAGLGEGA